MTKYIIFPQENGSVALVIPAPDCGISIEEIARKDVPEGTPYMIVDASDIPEDHTFFNAWEADFSSPDGYGIGQDAWFAEQEAIRKAAEEQARIEAEAAEQARLEREAEEAAARQAEMDAKMNEVTE